MLRNRLMIALLCGLLWGCGADDPSRVAKDVRDRAERVRDQARTLQTRAEKLSEKVTKRVQAALDDLEKAVPQATPSTRPPSTRGRAQASEIDRFLTETLRSVDAYWTQTLKAAGRPEPRVAYHWVSPGERLRTGCGAVADDNAGFYCPADDTIYVAQVMAAELYQGLNDRLPGELAGYGHAVGDFGVAYIVAHEYAHNIQNEFGTFRQSLQGSSKPFELQADCMAGLWGNSAYRAGKLKEGDIEEAMNTALAVGDFDYSNRNHHGTPTERRDAWVTGFRNGNPADCQPFVAG